MKQQGYLLSAWLFWLAVLALAVLVVRCTGWLVGSIVVAVAVFAQFAHLHWIPRNSALVGYGSVAEAPADTAQALIQSHTVTFYTASVCPFRPLVREQLARLQGKLEFDLNEVGVAFRPGLVRSNGFRAVPVVEIGNRLWVGNATSAPLAAFLTGDSWPTI